MFKTSLCSCVNPSIAASPDLPSSIPFSLSSSSYRHDHDLHNHHRNQYLHTTCSSCFWKCCKYVFNNIVWILFAHKFKPVIIEPSWWLLFLFQIYVLSCPSSNQLYHEYQCSVHMINPGQLGIHLIQTTNRIFSICFIVFSVCCVICTTFALTYLSSIHSAYRDHTQLLFSHLAGNSDSNILFSSLDVGRQNMANSWSSDVASDVG